MPTETDGGTAWLTRTRRAGRRSEPTPRVLFAILLFERPGRRVLHEGPPSFVGRLSHQDFGADLGPKGSGRNPPSRASRNALWTPDCMAAISSARRAMFGECAMHTTGMIHSIAPTRHIALYLL